MRVELTDNKYFKAFLDEDLGLYELYWQESSEEMTDEEYKTLMTLQVEILQTNEKIKGIQNYCQLLDNRLNFFTMSPELQEWQNKYVGIPVVETLGYYPKTAFIQSEDFITQLSFEQTMDETDEISGLVRYFDNELDAKSWLLDI